MLTLIATASRTDAGYTFTKLNTYGGLMVELKDTAAFATNLTINVTYVDMSGAII